MSDPLADVIAEAYETYGGTPHPWDFAANNVRAHLAAVLDAEELRSRRTGRWPEVAGLIDSLRATLRIDPHAPPRASAPPEGTHTPRTATAAHTGDVRPLS